MLKRFLNFLKTANNPGKIHEYQPPNDLAKSINKIFSNDFYDSENIHKLESWLFYNYLNNNDSLTEKKYKMVVLSLVFDQKSIYLEKMPLINDMIKDISKELIENKETAVNIHEIFPVDDDFSYVDMMIRLNRLQSSYRELEPIGIDLIPYILDEDSIYPEKIDIAKNIYKNFSSLGLLANTFINSKYHTDIFMRFQESKFNEGDITVFKNFIKKVTDPNYDNYHSASLSLDYWTTLISNENNIDNLKVFKKIYLHHVGDDDDDYSFYSTLLNQNDTDPQEDAKKYLINLVEKRIDYLELNNSLGMPINSLATKTKRAKI